MSDTINTDVVERMAAHLRNNRRIPELDALEAIDTITTLRAEVERLKREWGRAAWRVKTWRMASQSRRADNISLRAERDALIARAEKLEAALKPFAEHDDFHASDDWAVTQIDDGSPDLIPGVTAGDFKRAKAAIASLTEGDGE